MTIPEAFWELSLGIYLIVKGYRTPAIAALESPAADNDRLAPRRCLGALASAGAPYASTTAKEAIQMPKVSKDSAPQRQEAGPVVDLRDELDGYTVTFTSLLEDIDATPFMKGLPDDRCHCPHWGYVIKGKMTARYADRDEVFEAGDAFYTPPGHIPVSNEPGTEFVSFSPSEELRTAEAVMMKNMQAMQDGSTP